ncbi:MAG: DNA polymerase III subunit gamma/tau [Oscillospiraceae bacterium]|nr:DNA polymerase III subunit gamma/tau [Oscillospiraceae bacterium]
MYQALYRKWRPQTFDDVIGQQHITETLKNQVRSSRLSHAYIFIGTRGTGKTTCARILARAVNCEHPVDGNPCGTCAACRGIADGSILDVVELDAASNNGVDNVRALREEAVFSPAAVKKRVYIIDEVHMLSASAFNALLKIIEEPPEHLIFILATTELQKVPATILSRCQRHSFRRIDTAELAAYVEHVANAEHFAITHEAAELIARLAEGGVRDALSLLDQCSAHDKIDVDAVYTTMGLAGKRRIEELFDRVIDHDTESALKSFSKMWMDGKDPIGTLGELFTLMRDVLMLRVAPKGGAELISGGHEIALLRRYAARLTSEELTAGMGTLQDALIAARSARSPRTTAELCLVTLCSSLLKQDMPDFNARLSRIEEELASGAISFIPRGGSPAPAPREADEEPFEEPEEERPPLPEEDDLPWNEEPPAPAAPCAPWEDEADELDPAQFAEPQPEDALPKRAALPEKKPEPQSVKEPVSTAPPAAAESPAFWSELCRKIGARLPADMRIYPGDETKLRGELRGNVLTLEAEGGFVYNRFNRAEILQRFSDCAAEITGRSVNTILKVLDPAKRETRSLDELKKFPETHVIGQS